METTRPAQAARRSDGRCNSMVGRVDKERVDQKHASGRVFFVFRSARNSNFQPSGDNFVLVHAGLEGPRSTFARRFTTLHDKRYI